MSAKALNEIKGVIFDIDGTLMLNGEAISGAVNTVNSLRKQLTLGFATNTTSQSPEQIANQLQQLGFEIYPEEIQTSVTACNHLLNKKFNGKSGYFAIPDSTRQILAPQQETQVEPDFVVMGDLEHEFNYDVLNRIFNYLMQGAQLITFHRNPYFFRDNQTLLDSGAFTMAFEAITKKTTIVTGKPNPAIFDSAVESMGLNKEQVLIVGDDVSSDIQGAVNANITSALVGTGKFQPEHLANDQPKANLFLHQVSELLDWFSS